MNIISDIFYGILDSDSVLSNEPMNKHTSYKIGGNCDVMLIPDRIDKIPLLIDICNKNNIPFYIVGNGSNILVKDNGIRGAVIKLSNKLSAVTVEGNIIKIEAGAALSQIVRKAYEHSLSGLEFAVGIPGTFGGAVTMNAGAYGGHMADIVKNVTVCDKYGNIYTLTNEELSFGYRQSAIRDKNLIVLAGEIELFPSEQSQIKEKTETISAKRRAMQPLSYPSCGSVFKRPERHFIGKLIEDAGLKGTRVGGAEVSQLHANFIINTNNATAEDVLSLIQTVKARVYEKFNIEIETEVIVVGE